MRVVLLSGGVGGARLARGFPAVVDVDATVVVNVGDDDSIYGLWVSADLDTVVHTLAGVEGPQGWGRADETWNVMDALAAFPVDTSFRLGDTDLATNLFRTDRLAAGVPLSEITAGICATLGVDTKVLPATDDRVATRVRTDGGEWLDFQTYFVRRRHRDQVSEVIYQGAESAQPAPGVLQALETADAVIIGPSNPPLSVLPILAVPGIREAVASAAHVVGVSPLIGGAAVKGPAAELLASLGYPPGNRGVLAAYEGLVTDMVVHYSDREDLGVNVLATDIMIPDAAAASRLAEEIVSWLR